MSDEDDYYDYDLVIHKCNGRWSKQDLMDAGLDTGYTDLWVNTDKILCNRSRAYMKTDPASTSDEWRHVTCKSCKRMLKAEDSRIDKILFGLKQTSLGKGHKRRKKDG